MGSAASSPSTRRRLTRLAGWAASIAILAATAILLRDRFTEVGEAGGFPGAVPSAAAVLLFVVANAVLADTWRRMVALAGPRLPWRTAAWIWSVSQLARYTVGAAQVGGRAVVGMRYGLTATAGVVSTLVEIGWQLSITSAMVLATVPWWLPGAEDLTYLAWLGVAPVAVLVVGSVAPQQLLQLIARVLRTGPLRRLTGGRVDRAAEQASLTRRAAAALTGRLLLNSGLRLVAFLGLFAAVGGDLGRHGLLAVGASAVGQLAGRLAVFAPGGIGPREGVTALLVAPVLGGGPALVLVAAVRLLEVLAELAFFGVARFMKPPRPAEALERA